MGEMVEQLVSRTDVAYQRWLAGVSGDVAADTTGLSVFCWESVLERNTTYEVGEWLPGYLMIAQEGDRGFFLRCDGGGGGDSDGGPVFSADLGALGSVDPEVVAPAFEVWLRAGFTLPPDPEPDMPLIADVYIDRMPVGAVALLLRARKLLGADWRVADLKGMLATQPFLAAGSARPYQLRHALTSVSELQQHLFYATDDGLKAVWADQQPRDR
ncbi:hypothetical protein GCM10010435_28610 [Winogradskya consettensis]|uniref:Uncharacterized protein n=1 Tax=Winogradskya consettensis TaxID=113560 RepID=A0A919VVI7_9ACTN|nr:hypothetical protein [Actinoplanes consettensis]GIM70933.1 hypothetical protein Aco04nite_22900 [Actinoplanes consettensis]